MPQSSKMQRWQILDGKPLVVSVALPFRFYLLPFLSLPPLLRLPHFSF